MKSRSRALAAVLCLLAPALVATSPALAAGKTAPKHSASSLLFVQETQGGELARVGPGVYRLVFDDVSPTVATFTDRPRRRAGAQGLSGFVHGWAGDGFASDPPNATLVIHGAPSSHDVAMLTLSHPRYDRRARRLAYTAKPLHGPGSESLAGFSRRGDPLAPLGFRGASLFVDDAGSDMNYVPLSLQVSVDAPASEEAVLQISPGSSASWSLGRPGNRVPGLQLNAAAGGLVPLTRLSVSPTEISFRTSAEPSNSYGFTLNLEVESPADDDFLELSGVVPPGISISASVDGGETSTWSSGMIVAPLVE